MLYCMPNLDYPALIKGSPCQGVPIQNFKLNGVGRSRVYKKLITPLSSDADVSAFKNSDNSLLLQMDSSFKQALISENARRSLSMWKQRAGSRSSCASSSRSLLHETSATSANCLLEERPRTSSFSRSRGGSSSGTKMPRREAALSTRGQPQDHPERAYFGRSVPLHSKFR
ncbi:uncharacterized protein J3R85_008955 [Psidium guajava]|nr:uncharacterized protein J3R85_008955 [Psidium guajava]